MGQSTFEARLRRRLLTLVAPTVLGVAMASVLVTRHALRVADRATASERGQELLRELRRELAESEPLSTVLSEIVGDAEAEGQLIELRGPGVAGSRAGARPLPPRLAALATGSCAEARDTQGRPWVGCHVADRSVEAIVALPIDGRGAILRTVGFGMAAVVGLALLGLMAAARLALRPPLAALQRLVEWSEQVAESGELRPAPAADIAEIQQLARAFDALVQQLGSALGRERATSAHIAHELRTPLTTLRAELEALAPTTGATAERLLSDVDRLARVIDAILVLSSPHPTTPSREIVNVADVARALATGPTRVEAPDEALVEADERLVELALGNLLENAVRHGGGPATVLAITRVDDRVRIAVSDAGPGLNEASRSRMFDRHWRASEDGGGSGLGLALVRAVAERFGGSAEALPHPTGRGLTVAFTLGPLLEWHPGSAPEER